MKNGMGHRLIEARAAVGKTPEEIASEYSISAQAIRDYEKGSSKPGTEALRALAYAYKVTADWILGIPPVRRR